MALSDPIARAVAAVPSDVSDLPGICSCLYVGVTGNVQVNMAGGGTVLFSNLAVGWHPIRAARVWATNTTATNIVAGYQI